MKNQMYITLLILPLLATGCGGRKETAQTMPVPEISVARPTVQNMTRTKEYPGYLTSEKTVDLVGRVSGTLQTIAYAPGSRVRQGQVLFVIEPTVYQDNVRQAEAELNTARANLEYAQNNYTRMQEAMKSDAVSRIQVLQAQSNVATSQAAVSNAEAALNTARTNLSYCTVRAPFDGTVSRNLVDAGGYVGGSVQPVTLATIYKDDHLYTYFKVADNQWLSMLMQQGDSIPRQVSVSLGKDELLTYPAQLDYLSPNVDLNTGTLNIRARLDNPKGLLKSGLYVSITLPYGEQQQAILLPDASIGTDQLGKYIYVVNDSNIVRYRHIETGQLIGDSLRQIRAGITPRERYVTKALMKVRDGLIPKPMFSKFFIDRPIFATVLALLIVVAGLVTLGILPIAQYPDITPPTVQVSAVYPGANAQTVAQTVGIPIEQQVNGVDGMLYMSSNSSSSGAYSLTITFAVGTDIDMATVQVQNRVSVAQSSLPTPVVVQGVTVQKQSSNIVMFLTMTSDSKDYDGLYLSNYAKLNLVDQLTRVPGVGAVNVMGAGDYSMRIWLDPAAMRIRYLSPADVYQAIQSQNVEVSAGNVGQPIGTDNKNAYQYSLTVKGRLTSPEEFGNIILRTETGGKILRLRDVAHIDLGSASYSVVSQLDGKPTAAIAIYQQPGSNSLDVSKGVKAKMQELSQNFPAGIQYNVTLDTTDVIHASIDEVMVTFLETTLLVVLVIFLFLQNWRAVVIPCITIPVSLIGTLAVMSLFGFSINTLTLFGLILAVAIVVDDAIVVVENSTRLLDTGRYTSRQAVTEAMGEITGPIVGVVLVLLAVFIPTTLVSGISGQLYKQFALTIAASTVLSGFNSLTLTPALCALMLQPTRPSKNPLYRGFNHLYDKTQGVYDRIVEYLLQRPVASIVSYAVFTLIAVLLFVKWPSTFVPEEDDGYFLAVVQLPPASSLERTQAVGKQINKSLDSYPEIKDYIGISGFSVMGGGEQSNAATYFIVLKNWNERKGKEHTAEAVVQRFNMEVYGIQEAEIFAMVPPAIPGLGATGGLQLQLEDRHNLGATEMQRAVETLMEHYRNYPALASVSSQYQANVPQYFLNIDRDKVQLMGIPLNSVFTALGYYMGEAYVNDYVQFGHIYQVKLGAGDRAQRVIDDVLKLSVPNASGEMVPFSSFTRVEEQLGMDQINRYNMYSTAAVTCNVAPGSSSGEGIRHMESLIKEHLGDEFGYEWTSVAYQETQAGTTTTVVFVMALLVAFLVLAAQYESWTSPVAAVMGLPVALLGAMLGCYVMGTPVSIYTQIGIILLVALSAKNGILIVEFARDFRAQGNSIRDAAFQAGHIRLRPILMTSLAFVFGVMPLLFATGAGAGSRIALGAAVVFGMALNTLLATVYIPNFYELMQKLQEKFSKKQ